MPVVPESQQWVSPLHDIAIALRPRLDDALKDGDASVRQEALRGIVGPVAWANPRAPLPVDLLKLLVGVFDADPSPSIRASVLTASFMSYHAPDRERAALAKGLLLRALEDPDPNVVQTAGWGAVESRCPEALPLLVRQLKNVSAVARMGVAAGLQAYALEARRFLPELEAALAREPDGPTRSTLEATVAKIRNSK
jgi:hypothetical protein